MSPAELTLAITAAANAIAETTEDDIQLELISAALGQLSAALAVIAAQRSINSGNNKSEDIVI
ncbi:MAG: hypothetical protein ACI4Q6_01870 [Huintestinicola sp.]